MILKHQGAKTPRKKVYPQITQMDADRIRFITAFGGGKPRSEKLLNLCSSA
jgi:hypothetical protein